MQGYLKAVPYIRTKSSIYEIDALATLMALPQTPADRLVDIYTAVISAKFEEEVMVGPCPCSCCESLRLLCEVQGETSRYLDFLQEYIVISRLP